MVRAGVFTRLGRLAVARAFDVLGERWTPLLLRELAIGPRRYADLLEGLPGVSPSLLTQRLRELEGEGIVRRSYLPPPAARGVYELTDEGTELARALIPLARWGARRMGVRREGETFSLTWVLLYLRATADTAAARGVHDLYEFHVDDHAFHVTVDDGHVDARVGPAPRPPDLVVRTDLETFAAIGGGTLADDVAQRLRVEGDPDAADRCLRVLAPSSLAAPA
ncbi:MAG TPA: winged helix-turn-helix transcriptional regulator [Acidimicrobiales bacterium]|nr:winged helix-turn-helix transcriptional regulator [Acidimicrobiales bacterium]